MSVHLIFPALNCKHGNIKNWHFYQPQEHFPMKFLLEPSIMASSSLYLWKIRHQRRHEHRKFFGNTVFLRPFQEKKMLFYAGPLLTQFDNNLQKHLAVHIVLPPLPPPFLSAGRGGWTSYQIFKRGSLTEPQLWEGGCWKRGGNFFRGLQFYKKSKLKSEILNDKKVYKQKYFSLL